MIGQGRTAEIFAWGGGQALKLYRRTWPAARVEAEATITRKAHDAGLPVPAVAGTVEVDGRFGIIFDRVRGPSLLRRFVARPWTVVQAAALLADLHAKIHGCKVPGLPSQRERLERMIHAAAALPTQMREAALAVLAGLPGGDALCHGDFHPDNIVMTASGPVIIDWAAGSCGDPLADVAQTWILIRVGALLPDTARRVLLKGSRAVFHRLYLRHYLQARHASRAQVEAWLLPVAAARLSDGIASEEEHLLSIVSTLCSGSALIEKY